MIYVLLAEGFEEVEALATVDMLRRANIEVKTVGVPTREITGGHGITVKCDLTQDEAQLPDGIVLPGGMPGTIHLEQSEFVQTLIQSVLSSNGLICAICAAPSILGHLGLLNGKRATCFPGFEQDMTGHISTEDFVAVDGNLITAKGPGSAIRFGLAIVEKIAGTESAKQVADSLQYAP